LEQTTTKPNDRSAVICWIRGWRLLIIFTAFSFLSHTYNDSTQEITHIAVLCVGMMSAVFGVTSYPLWPRLSFLFFIGTLAAHLGHMDFATGLASASTSDLLTGFIADSRMAIFEIILAASVTFIGKSMMRVKHGPDGYIDTLDISLILTRRFLFALLTLPVVTIALLETASFFMGDFHWQDPILLGELRDYTIGIIAFIPLGIGTAIYMTGGPWLEPRLRPVRRYFVLYVAAAIILNLVFALTDVGKSTFAVEISFALLCAVSFVSPHAILIGVVQLLSTTSILFQYALWQHTDITAYFVIPAISFATLFLFTLRTLSQVKMNTLVQQTQQQGALLNTFVRNGPHYFLVQD